MKSLKEFKEFLEKGVVQKITPDKLRADNLIKESERKLNFINNVLQKIGLDDTNANDIIEDCYDVVANLIRAKMFSEGFSASGKGSHEAEISYLRNLNFNEDEINLMNQLRYFRNGIMYYGKQFDKEYAKKVYDFLIKIKERLG